VAESICRHRDFQNNDRLGPTYRNHGIQGVSHFPLSRGMRATRGVRGAAGTFAGTLPKSAVGTGSIGWARGADLEVVQEQLGHASTKTTTIYAKVTKKDKARAAHALVKAFRHSQHNRASGASWPRRRPPSAHATAQSAASSCAVLPSEACRPLPVTLCPTEQTMRRMTLPGRSGRKFETTVSI